MQELIPQVKNTRHKILVVNPTSLGLLIFLDLGLGRAWDFGLSIMQRMAQKSESILHHFIPRTFCSNMKFLIFGNSDFILKCLHESKKISSLLPLLRLYSIQPQLPLILKTNNIIGLARQSC